MHCIWRGSRRRGTVPIFLYGHTFIPLSSQEAFFAPVEAQKRGYPFRPVRCPWSSRSVHRSLHLHLLGWLANVPDPTQLSEMVKDNEFKTRLFEFLDRNVSQGFLDKAEFGGQPLPLFYP